MRVGGAEREKWSVQRNEYGEREGMSVTHAPHGPQRQTVAVPLRFGRLPEGRIPELGSEPSWQRANSRGRHTGRVTLVGRIRAAAGLRKSWKAREGFSLWRNGGSWN